MADDEQERRSDSRRNVNLQVEYPDRQAYRIDSTESVSPSGIFIRSAQHHRVGEQVRIAISLPGFPGTVQLTGEVSRIREATPDQERGVALSIPREQYDHGFAALLSPTESREFSLSSGPYALLAALPRVRLATTPTPLHRAERLSRELGGPDIWFKRDDLTGFAMGGNMVRKMELVVADALEEGADTLVTGTRRADSRWIRVMSAAAARLGLRAVSVAGSGFPDPKGEPLPTQLFGGELVAFPEPEASIDDNIDIMVDKIRSEGHRPYGMTEADTGWLGACGYMLASIEIIAQMRRLQLEADVLVCPVGSGETMSGLVAAQRWLDSKHDVLGISVSANQHQCCERVATLAYDTSSRLQIDDTIPVDDIWINDEHIGEDRGIASQESLDATKLVAGLEGILLDPKVSGIAMAGLIQLIERGEFRKGQSIVFLHTGGWA